MKTLYFHNPSELDIRGATTMGLSAKGADDAIGKFGTGLKYAIASILRWGGAVSIKTGGEIYEFSKNPISFRGKEHDQIIMRRRGTAECKELGYTTHYGSHWKPWQIFRELYSNARDESGGCTPSIETAAMETASPDSCLITVDCPKVAECYFEKDTIILPTQGAEFTNSNYKLSVIRCPSNFLYYRSVRVHDKKCLVTWNLGEGCDLTEDRTLQDTYYHANAAAEYIQAQADYDFCYKMLTAAETYFEGGLGYSKYNHTSKEFINAATTLYKQKGKQALPSGVWAILVQAEPSLDAPEVVKLTKVQQKMLDRAIELVARMGMPVNDYPVEVVNFQKNTLGMAKDGKVWLSPQVFNQGTKQVVSTLYEEVLHLSTGLKDCCYEMQTHLFNTIVSLYEEHVFQEAC